MTRRRPGTLDTRLVHRGRGGRSVSPPVVRASTLLFDRAEDLYHPAIRSYGIHGSPAHDALLEAWSEVEDASHGVLVASGLLACTLPLLIFAEPGAHILVSDNVYGPTRRFCDRMMTRLGCAVEYFPPRIGAGVGDRIGSSTRLVFMEAPGSLTFETPDVAAITGAAQARSVATAIDNTWSAGVHFRPLDLGVDLSIQAGTKYPSGGADVLIGAVFTRSAGLHRRLTEAIAELGLHVSPDDAWLTLRGLRSMPTRLRRHEASGLEVARWLAGRPEVEAVLHPALPGHPDHEVWRRLFTGSAGVFGVALAPPAGEDEACACLNALSLFGLGFSWGGFESLAITCGPQLTRTAGPHDGAGRALLRLSIGLEDPADLIADLERGLAAMAAAPPQSAV